MRHRTEATSEKLSWKKVKTAKYCVVGLVYVEYFWQELTLHQPGVSKRNLIF
jgi:hypothetical protein